MEFYDQFHRYIDEIDKEDSGIKHKLYDLEYTMAELSWTVDSGYIRTRWEEITKQTEFRFNYRVGDEVIVTFPSCNVFKGRIINLEVDEQGLWYQVLIQTDTQEREYRLPAESLSGYLGCKIDLEAIKSLYNIQDEVGIEEFIRDNFDQKMYQLLLDAPKEIRDHFGQCQVALNVCYNPKGEYLSAKICSSTKELSDFEDFEWYQKQSQKFKNRFSLR